MNYVLFDDAKRRQLFPLTMTRSAADLRCGILTIREKWEKRLQAGTVPVLAEAYLQPKYGTVSGPGMLINSRWLPDESSADTLHYLGKGEALYAGETLLACYTDDVSAFSKIPDHSRQIITAHLVEHTYDLFTLNGAELRRDFELVTHGRESAPLGESNIVIGDGPIFIEENATVEGAMINAGEGPVYIGKGAEIMEGCLIRGGLALCEGAVLKMGAKIYGPTTVGPHSRVGGEVNNSVILGYSNKGHDGFLGNSVLGEWCNLGADTNTSNLKNNYAEVRIWDYESKTFAPTGRQFCGLIMGDHSKCGINTMFNTGTVVGVSANLFGAGFPRNFVPSFAWGGAAGFSTYQLKKVYEVAEVVMSRRSVPFTDSDKSILETVFEMTAENRFWEKRS